MNKTKNELLENLKDVAENLKNIVEELAKKESETVSNITIVNNDKEKLIEEFFKTLVNYNDFTHENLDLERHFSQYQQFIKDTGTKVINIKNFVSSTTDLLEECCAFDFGFDDYDEAVESLVQDDEAFERGLKRMKEFGYKTYEELTLLKIADFAEESRRKNVWIENLPKFTKFVEEKLDLLDKKLIELKNKQNE